MKSIKFLSIGAFMAISFSAFSQVQVDKQIQMTGSTSDDRRITNVGAPADSLDAVNARVIQRNSLTYAADAGTANAYAVTLAPAMNTYSAGMIVHFKATNANTGASTLNVNGFGAIAIVKNFNTALASNDIKSGQVVSVMYDGSSFQMLSQLGNASSSSGGSDPTLIYTTNGF